MLILLTLCDQLYDPDCAHPAPAFALTSRSRTLLTALDAVLGFCLAPSQGVAAGMPAQVCERLCPGCHWESENMSQI